MATVRRTAFKATIGGLVWFLAVAACRKPAAPTSEDAGLDAGLVQVATPPELELSVELELPDGGRAEVAFDGGQRPRIESTKALALSTNLPLQNYRVRLFDEGNRAMVSDDRAIEDGDKLHYQISLPAPLKTGHRYTLVVDAQSGSALADADGRTLADRRLEFEVEGPRVKDAPPPKKKRTRRRR